jgi:hypothetical protein
MPSFSKIHVSNLQSARCSRWISSGSFASQAKLLTLLIRSRECRGSLRVCSLPVTGVFRRACRLSLSSCRLTRGRRHGDHRGQPHRRLLQGPQHPHHRCHWIYGKGQPPKITEKCQAAILIFFCVFASVGAGRETAALLSRCQEPLPIDATQKRPRCAHQTHRTPQCAGKNQIFIYNFSKQSPIGIDDLVLFK